MRGQKYVLPKPTNPEITCSEARETFELQGKLEQFKRFARNTKNPFLRQQIYYRQHGICPYCNKPLPSYIYGVSVHHNDYLRCCVLESEQMRVYTPYKQKRSSAKVPNCEICYYYFPDESEECLAKLALLHNECHERLHNIENRKAG